MESILHTLTKPQLEDIVRELNIRSRIPKYTKVNKLELIDKLKDVIEMVEKDDEMHFVVK